MSRHAASSGAPKRRRGGRIVTTTAVVLALAGAGGLGAEYLSRHYTGLGLGTPAPPAAPQRPGASGTSPGPRPSASRSVTGLVLARSMPVRLDIPSIGVNTSIMELGVNPDRTVAVPPIEANSPAGWYRMSPTPGQLGPSVLLGHVTVGKFGKGVFFRLATLHPGDHVNVHRADGSVAVFSVDKVAEYPKSQFPTQAVYGNIDHAGLRLITCGGARNAMTQAYSDNVVVYASLVSATAASA